MRKTNFFDGVSWFVGIVLLVCVSWMLVGLIARAIKTLFCVGYGC